MQEEFANIFQELTVVTDEFYLVKNNTINFVNGITNVDDPKTFKNIRAKFNELKIYELKISSINKLIEQKFNEIYEESKNKHKEDKQEDEQETLDKINDIKVANKIATAIQLITTVENWRNSNTRMEDGFTVIIKTSKFDDDESRAVCNTCGGQSAKIGRNRRQHKARADAKRSVIHVENCHVKYTSMD